MFLFRDMMSNFCYKNCLFFCLDRSLAYLSISDKSGAIHKDAFQTGEVVLEMVAQKKTKQKYRLMSLVSGVIYFIMKKHLLPTEKSTLAQHIMISRVTTTKVFKDLCKYSQKSSLKFQTDTSSKPIKTIDVSIGLQQMFDSLKDAVPELENKQSDILLTASIILQKMHQQQISVRTHQITKNAVAILMSIRHHNSVIANNYLFQISLLNVSNKKHISSLEYHVKKLKNL